MLFRDKLDEIREALQPEFERLFTRALSSQAHEGDLLLIAVNGSYDPKMSGVKLANGEPASLYVSGPGSSGLADATHYDFIHQYRSTIHYPILSDYISLHEWSQERREEIDRLLKEEETTIHLETLIYLKIWEGDHYAKVWYQFVQCLLGKPYDWHFKVKSSNRDTEGIAVRHKLLRIHIRDEIKQFSEPVYEAFKKAYNTQIRNSIAHSNFSFLGRNIHPNNFIDGDPSHQLHHLPFDTWIEMFHTTIILHNFYIWLKNKINMHYGGMWLNRQTPQEIKIVKPNGEERYRGMNFRPEFQDWR